MLKLSHPDLESGGTRNFPAAVADCNRRLRPKIVEAILF